MHIICTGHRHDWLDYEPHHIKLKADYGFEFAKLKTDLNDGEKPLWCFSAWTRRVSTVSEDFMTKVTQSFNEFSVAGTEIRSDRVNSQVFCVSCATDDADMIVYLTMLTS